MNLTCCSQTLTKSSCLSHSSGALRLIVGVVVSQWEVPHVPAVTAAVGDHIIDFPDPIFWGVGQQMAWASAVDTDNGLFRTNHRRSLPCVRVVAGDLRGRRIEAPTSEATRPTTDMVREAVFNALGSLDVVQGARVLDLFAGTGAMGIEAISRGAAHCVFVENDRAALAVLRSNIAALGISEKSTVIAGDAVGTAAHQQGIDLLIADPPYGFDAWGGLLASVTAPLVVLESGRPIGPIIGFETVREKKYGRTHVAFLSPSSAPEGTVEVQ